MANITISDKVSELAKKDILELEQKINLFQNGKMDEEKFRAFRLARGVYGQRQLGVQMVRIKFSYGRITTKQLDKVAEVSEIYTNGRLHLTTRQNIQIHYIKVDDSPQLWENLEQEGITMKEACGNTVRTITASPKAGVDPEEAFDVSPYAEDAFRFFLRNPICQDMGRKFKMAFSSSKTDSAYVFMHDLGFIPVIQNNERGFQVVIGGGLGAATRLADKVYDFLPENKLIPFTEATIRVFDRYGERTKRHYARLKFLIKKMGVAPFLELVEQEMKSIKNQTFDVDRNIVPEPKLPVLEGIPIEEPTDAADYALWKQTNVFPQKQAGYVGANIKIQLGNLSAAEAREFSAIVRMYAADDIRITANQGFSIRFIKEAYLPNLYNVLKQHGFASYGFQTLADVTSCPGTDTCNLAVSNSTSLAIELENMVKAEYQDLVLNDDLHIKISGCMNSCGQHMIANIGFHGASIQRDKKVAPAMHLVMGGGINPDGSTTMAEKLMPVPSKRIPDVVRALLNDYKANKGADHFNAYYARQGKRYFSDLLKPLTDKTNIQPSELIDWGTEDPFSVVVGTGECAGVTYDLVETILGDANEKIALAQEALKADMYYEAIYHSYTGFVVGAKASLLSKDIACNTHINIMKDFDTHFVQEGLVGVGANKTFSEVVLEMKSQAPSKEFATKYLAIAKDFVQTVTDMYQQRVSTGAVDGDKKVVDNFYKA